MAISTKTLKRMEKESDMEREHYQNQIKRSLEI